MQCAPDLTAAGLAATPLGALSLEHLTALHVMELDDDALRYYLPRMMELLLLTSAPVFDFRVWDVKIRMVTWTGPERSALQGFATAVWAELLSVYPADLGYFSDSPSALDLVDWCGLPLGDHLDALLTGPVAAARHLADLVDAVFTRTTPFKTVSKSAVLNWIAAPAVGERLQDAFFATSGSAAQELSAAYQLWAVCAGR